MRVDADLQELYMRGFQGFSSRQQGAPYNYPTYERQAVVLRTQDPSLSVLHVLPVEMTFDKVPLQGP